MRPGYLHGTSWNGFRSEFIPICSMIRCPDNWLCTTLDTVMNALYTRYYIRLYYISDIPHLHFHYALVCCFAHFTSLSTRGNLRGNPFSKKYGIIASDLFWLLNHAKNVTKKSKHRFGVGSSQQIEDAINLIWSDRLKPEL